LHRARDYQLTDAWRHTTPDGREREESGAATENTPPAETVTHRASDKNQSGEKERVRFNYP
jgi:hypothetical protein